MLDFESYAQRIAAELALPVSRSVSKDTGLYDDLGLDSLEAFELLLLTEDWAGEVRPRDLALGETGVGVPIFTLGDAYDYYLGLCRD